VLAPAPKVPLATKQGCGFVMANIGLVGTANELGITFSNLWVQPATAANGWDALKGVEEYLADPLGCPLDLLPVGVCFPSTKHKASASSSTCRQTSSSSKSEAGANDQDGDGDDDPGFHTCQVLVPAEWSWFSQHAPTPPPLPSPAPPLREAASEQMSAIAGALRLQHWARHATASSLASSSEKGVKKKEKKENGAAAAAGARGGGGGVHGGASGSSNRRDPEGYAKLKQLWAERLVAVLQRHYPQLAKKGAIQFVDVSTPLSIEHYTRPGLGAAIGLDVTPERFVDPHGVAETNHRHPRVEGLWRAGQDYLMTGQVLAAASGIVCALRMLGPLDMLRFFFLRAPRLLFPQLISSFWGKMKSKGAAPMARKKSA